MPLEGSAQVTDVRLQLELKQKFRLWLPGPLKGGVYG
jgi:hypothetical protein